MIRNALMSLIGEPVSSHSLKVSIIGAGKVGMAVAMALVSQKICNELSLVDKKVELAKGEAMDLEEGAVFTGCRIYSSEDYSVTVGSKVIIITAGSRQAEGESEVEWAKKNTEVMKEIVPQILAYNEDPIILVLSSPVDSMTYVVWKLSGLPQSKVMGSGTTLDSARFRHLIADRLEVNPKSVHGFIIGAHGQHSVPIWSSVTVGGVRLMDISPDIGTEKDPEDWKRIHTDVIESGKTIRAAKQSSCWAVAICAARIVEAMLLDSLEIFSVSTLIKGCQGDKEVFMSMPCVLGRNGVLRIIKETTTDYEKEKLYESASSIYDVVSQLNV